MKQYREVKREVKVGDKIKVVNATVSFGHYKNGDILDVIKLDLEKRPIISVPKSYNNPQGEFYLDSKEYVVVEEVNHVKEVEYELKIGEKSERIAKVGDWIKIVNEQDTKKRYKNGDIFKVVSVNEFLNKQMNVIRTEEGFDIWQSELVVIDNPTIIITQEDNKVIATNTLTGKNGIARCCPEDEFDFNIGAKLAFDRLQEEDKIDPIEGKSYLFEYEGKQYKGKLLDKSKKRWLHEKIWSFPSCAFDTTCFTSGKLKVIEEIEDIQPTPKFQVGDFVKVIANTIPYHYFPIGQIVKVIGIPREQRLNCKGIVVGSSGTPREDMQTINVSDVEKVGK